MMTGKLFATVGLAAGCALALGMAGPASAHNRRPLAPTANASDMAAGGARTASVTPADWSARRDVIESREYDHLLETDPAFRHVRMRKECGPITLPKLHQECLASFRKYEPLAVRSS